MSRDWMTKRGKASLVYFDREQIKTLYDYYQQLDGDGKGYIGFADVEDTLLSLGLASSKQEVIRNI